MDLSRMSTDDLLALRSGDLSRVSTQGLQALRGQQQAAAVDPTADMGTLDRLLAGAGRGMTSAGRGVKQALDEGAAWLERVTPGAQAINRFLGGPSAADILAHGRAGIDEARRLDAPLMATTAGKVGNVAGLAATALPTAFIPGANTFAGATAIGAGLGGLTTEGELQDRAKAALFGAAGGAAGKAIGDAAGTGARWLADQAMQRFATSQAANAQRMAAARAAADAGYVLPPADLMPGRFTEALSGLSGKIKTAQEASARNQAVTNDLARRAVGLPEGAPITSDALAAVRSQAGRSYDAVRGAGTLSADRQYAQAIDDLGLAHRNVMPDFPGLARSDVPGFLQGLKRDTFDASTAVDAVRLLRARADQAFRAGDSEMGRAAKAAAAELESLIERNLAAQESARQAIGKAADKLTPPGTLPGATLADFRDARQLMAKTYTLQKALNSETGDVSAQVLARELAKGKPLSGDLRAIAEAGMAFPKALQALKESPKATSPLDWGVAALAGTGTGNPLSLGLLAARPAARSMLLSPLYQRAALAEAGGPGLLSQLPAELLDQNLTRNAMPGLLGIIAAQAGR